MPSSAPIADRAACAPPVVLTAADEPAQLAPMLESQLCQHGAHVGLDGCGADAERGRDLSVAGIAFRAGHEVDDSALPGRESLERIGSPVRCGAEVGMASEPRDQGGLQLEAAAAQGSHAGLDVVAVTQALDVACQRREC